MVLRAQTLVAAGLLAGAMSASSYAADVGGDCCADLEARVSELEATTARKGNRAVSLQIYGQVNKALLIWDDGRDSDAYVVDHDQSGSRVGFEGSAGLRPGWSAGFNIELDIQDAASDKVDQDFDVGDDPADEIKIRRNYLYIEGDRFGRLSLGQQSSAADGISEIMLGNSLATSKEYLDSFFIRRKDNGLTNGQIRDFINNLDGPRASLLRYDSPALYGFILSASWGEDDYADIALRYKGEWSNIRLAAGVAYQWDDEADEEKLSGSVSAIHLTTGIYGALAGGTVNYTDNAPGVVDGDFWYGQLGVEKRLLPYGSTTVYGEYGEFNNVAAEDLSELEAVRWGLGIVQSFDRAALDLYANFRFYEFDDAGLTSTELENFSSVMVGSRIRF